MVLYQRPSSLIGGMRPSYEWISTLFREHVSKLGVERPPAQSEVAETFSLRVPATFLFTFCYTRKVLCKFKKITIYQN
ncbi:MAG: hypothetical protein UU66_C0035G0004 [Parcubacteria group bacterium GW2011_GWB1_41_5]|nr:MAG: hypothetical protein UU66_C0035G0004 [Parcubacteria group bacterium GW2011_GWB1_41_5]